MLYVCQCNPRYFWKNFNKNVFLEICEAPGNMNNNPNLPAGLQVNILKLCVCNHIAGSSDTVFIHNLKSPSYPDATLSLQTVFYPFFYLY